MEQVQQVVYQACNGTQSLSKNSLLAILANYYTPKYRLLNQTTTTSVQFIEQRHFLAELDYNSWTITSFNPHTREVCVQISTNSGSRIVSIILPTTT